MKVKYVKRRRRLPPAQQGGPDGLCGFYSLLNFFHNFTAFEGENADAIDRETFRYLAQTAEQLGLLNAQNLCDGFEWPKLRKIFDQVSQDWRVGFVAVPLQAVAESMRTDDIFTVMNEIVSEGGEAVIHLNNEYDHWVLAYDTGPDAIGLDDSEIPDAELKSQFIVDRKEAVERFALDTASGLALVPVASKLAALN